MGVFIFNHILKHSTVFFINLSLQLKSQLSVNGDQATNQNMEGSDNLIFLLPEFILMCVDSSPQAYSHVFLAFSSVDFSLSTCIDQISRNSCIGGFQLSLIVSCYGFLVLFDSLMVV